MMLVVICYMKKVNCLPADQTMIINYTKKVKLIQKRKFITVRYM